VTAVKRTLLALLVVVGCRGRSSEEAPVPTADARKLEIVYQLDLDAAVDDKTAALRGDLAAGLADKKLAATMNVTIDGLQITPTDPAQQPAIEQMIRTDYAGTIELVDCPSGVCVRLAAAYASTVKKAALAASVTAIRKRLAKARAPEASATLRGEEVVVRFTANDEQTAKIRDVIARRGKLEFKVVDDNAEFMKRLYVHVGYEGDEPTDPRAKADQIRAEIDQWREDGLHSDFYLIAPDREAEVTRERARQIGCFVGAAAPDALVRCRITGRNVIESYLQDLAMTDASFRLPDDRQIGYELVASFDTKDPRPMWRTYYLEREARVTGAMIASAKGELDDNTQRPLVMLEFTKAGGQAFGDLTVQILGRKLAAMVDGTIKSAPIINGPIRGGRAAITMGGSDPQRQLAERDELARVLDAGALPVTLREASARDVP
jgi:preprotein translocase subunit SecD